MALVTRKFALDSTDGGYAALLAAINTETESHLGYTPTHTIIDAAHDSNIKIVTGIVDDDQRTGGLSGIDRDNLGTVPYMDEMRDPDDWIIRGLDLIGTSGRTTIYIRPQRLQSAQGGAFASQTYGAEDGRTYATAISGPQNIWAAGNLTFVSNPSNNQTIGLNGVTWTFVTSGAAGNQTNIQGDLESTLTQLGTDLNASADAGIDDAFYKVTTTQLRARHKQYGSTTFALDIGTAADSRSAATLELLDGQTAIGSLTNGNTTFFICDEHIADRGSAAGDQRILMLNGTDVNNRVHFRFDYPDHPGKIWGGKILTTLFTDNGDGTFYSPAALHNTSTDPWIRDPKWNGDNLDGVEMTRVSSITECINTPDSHFSADYKFGGEIRIHTIDETQPQNRVMQPDQGLRFWVNDIRIEHMNIYDETTILSAIGHGAYPLPSNSSWLAGRRGGGRRRWARTGENLLPADRKDDSVGGHVENVVFEDMIFDRGNGGWYFIRVSSRNFQNVTLRRCTAKNMGGVIPGEADLDGHGMAAFGGILNWTIEDCVIENCGGHFNHYIPTASTNGTGMSVDGLIIRGGHPANWLQFGSESADVAFHCAQDADTVSDRSGAVIDNVTIKADAGVRHAFRTHWDDLVTVNFLTVEEGAYTGAGIRSNRSYNDAGTFRCSATKSRNHDISAGAGDFWSWVKKSTAANFGTDELVVDFDNGTYREGTAGDDDGTRFTAGSVGPDTFAQWQAEVETNSTFDPSSTLVTA